MNKGDLVNKIADECEMSKAAADKVVNSMLKAITNSVASGEKVSLIGFGTFSVNERAARQGRNPQTGKTMQIPAKKVVKFKAGKNFVEAANK